MRTLVTMLVFALAGISPSDAPKVPFSLAVVATSGSTEGGTIEMAQNKARDFYVVLTNVSGESQAIWESWNSWGYRTVSLEITTADGRTFVASRREEEFTRNGPSTFSVAPREHQVFAIRLGKGWETRPSLPKADEMPIKLKAIYEVSPTPEAAKQKVWTGRLESRSYNLTLRQW